MKSLKIERDELDKALDEINLSVTEKDVYLASLAYGPVSVSQLAEKMGYQRPYLYTVINELRSKGLVAGSGTRYKKDFVVESPSTVLHLLRKKRGYLDNLTSNLAVELPRYLASYKQGGNATQVFVYEGSQKFIELYEKIFEEEAEETLYFGELKHFLSVVTAGNNETWLKKRIEKKIWMRFLPVQTEEVNKYPSDPKEYRETRIIPPELCKELPATFQVFGNNVIFWQPETPAAIVLHDQYIANMQRKIFDLLWILGKPY